MRILLSNDDGYLAPGLQALHRALAAIADVDVIAPEHNNSAKSNALTLNAPLYVYHASNGFRYVNGTPADCVHLALTGLLSHKPDLVVSGINNGANMGDDTIYSGTVGAAMEGYLMGIPALAFSQVDKGWAELDSAASVAAQIVQAFVHGSLAPPALANSAWLLNVNIPNVSLDRMGQWTYTRLGRRHAAQPVTTQLNPRGETMYWIGAAGEAKDAGAGTDFDAVANGAVSITPLHTDLTAYAQLEDWRASRVR